MADNTNKPEESIEISFSEDTNEKVNIDDAKESSDVVELVISDEDPGEEHKFGLFGPGGFKEAICTYPKRRREEKAHAREARKTWTGLRR